MAKNYGDTEFPCCTIITWSHITRYGTLRRCPRPPEEGHTVCAKHLASQPDPANQDLLRKMLRPDWEAIREAQIDALAAEVREPLKAPKRRRRAVAKALEGLALPPKPPAKPPAKPRERNTYSAAPLHTDFWNLIDK